MHSVQIKSNSWEALYTEKPNYHNEADMCCFIDDNLVGICAGHEVMGLEKRTFSIEVLATHPLHSSKGIAKAMLINLFQKFNFNIECHLWTRSEEAYSIYSENWKLSLLDSIALSTKTGEQKEYFFCDENGEKNTWCFKLDKHAPFVINHLQSTR
jgi:hypothetical protein